MYQPTPISATNARKRLLASGLYPLTASAMSDAALLRLPRVGRRTLRWLRANYPAAR